MIQFARQVSGIPEEHLVNEFPTYTSDQPFNKRMGHGHMREGLDFLDLQYAKIGLPLRETEERIIVTAEVLQRPMPAMAKAFIRQSAMPSTAPT